MSRIKIIAGSEAHELINNRGFSSSMVKAVVAAAGGPKWFTTYGLVRYIIDDLLKDASADTHYIGSSVGSWQMAAATTSDPGAAIDRLQYAYANHIYTDHPDAQEITDACRGIISNMIGQESHNIVSGRYGRLGIFTSRGKGLLANSNKIALSMSFTFAAIAHSLKRSWLNNYIERVLFSNTDVIPYDHLSDDLETRLAKVDVKSLHSALSASGAIPMLMKPQKNIGPLTGTYWDGGITDYHIALPFNFGPNSIVLHPHFSPYVLAGWFDKKLPYIRHANPKLLSKVLLICPSDDFVNSLPMKKITDLKDFYYFDKDQKARIQYWNEVSERSKELGKELKEILESDNLANHLVRYDEHIRG